MPDQHNSNREEHEAENQPAPVPVMEPANPAPASDAANNQKENWHAKYTEAIKTVNWAHVLQAIGVVIAALVCYIYWGQLQVLSGQLRQMEEGSSQTAQLIVITANQASAAQRSAKAAENNIKAMQEASRLDQRAWVGVDALGIVLEVGKPLEVSIKLKNTGKTPARHIVGTVVLDPLRPGQKPQFSYETFPHVRLGVMPPGGEFTANVFGSKSRSTGKTAPMTEDLIGSINDGALVIYAHGRVEYDDIFGKNHWLTFCSFYTPNTKSFGACHYHNDTNEK